MTELILALFLVSLKYCFRLVRHYCVINDDYYVMILITVNFFYEAVIATAK